MVPWQGKFSSTLYPCTFWIMESVAGHITVDMPEDLTCVFKTTATLTYTGIHKFRQSSVFTFQSDLEKGIGVQEGATMFKGSALNSSQSITFTVQDAAPERISGKYFTENPSDEGIFVLNRV